MTTLNVNGRAMTVDADPSTPLLWALRDHLNLTGTKFGCGVAACGACTVHVNGQPTRACVTPISAVSGAQITTIEAMEADRVAARCRRPGCATTSSSAATARAAR